MAAPIDVNYDVFISHASEDKADVARPLAALLMRAGLRVWIDESELRLGDSLRRSIDAGLRRSRFGVVVLSPSFFAKEWPQKELDALVSLEGGLNKVVLPVWHNLDYPEVARFSPLLADRLAARSKSGLPQVAGEIIKVVRQGATEDEASRTDGGVPADFSHYLVEFLDQLQYMADAGHGITGVPTGFHDLDRLLSGLQIGDLHVVAARPATGSTSFALNIAAHVATHESLPVAYFSLQNRGQEVMNRLIASVGRINRHHLATGLLTDEEWPRLTEAIEQIRNVALYIDHVPEVDVDELLARADRCYEKTRLGLLVVDKLDLLVRDPVEADRVISKLSTWARRNGTPVLLVATVEPSVDKRIDKRPRMDDLASAEAVRRHAAAAMFLYRDDLYNRDSSEPGTVEVIVDHRRDGLTATVKLIHLRDIGRLESIALVPQAASR